MKAGWILFLLFLGVVLAENYSYDDSSNSEDYDSISSENSDSDDDYSDLEKDTDESGQTTCLNYLHSSASKHLPEIHGYLKFCQDNKLTICTRLDKKLGVGFKRKILKCGKYGCPDGATKCGEAPPPVDDQSCIDHPHRQNNYYCRGNTAYSCRQHRIGKEVVWRDLPLSNVNYPCYKVSDYSVTAGIAPSYLYKGQTDKDLGTDLSEYETGHSR